MCVGACIHVCVCVWCRGIPRLPNIGGKPRDKLGSGGCMSLRVRCGVLMRTYMYIIIYNVKSCRGISVLNGSPKQQRAYPYSLVN